MMQKLYKKIIFMKFEAIDFLISFTPNFRTLNEAAQRLN
jgi:hypothetical protein